jgi:transcriptional regulator with XRE-family HTH domain
MVEAFALGASAAAHARVAAWIEYVQENVLRLERTRLGEVLGIEPASITRILKGQQSISVGSLCNLILFFNHTFHTLNQPRVSPSGISPYVDLPQLRPSAGNINRAGYRTALLYAHLFDIWKDAIVKPGVTDK